MNWTLPPTERIYLRSLAARQAEIAALPIMEQRKHMWYALNDAQPGARPPVVIETWTFDRDFLPESVFQCLTPTGREIETQLLRNIRNHEIIDDDKVTPDTFDIGWFIEENEFGVEIPRPDALDGSGGVAAPEQWQPG
ncbi:MAG: hypothetical protein NT121_21225 [Chloroflexi bacterium]|nr:hypothetical protein [Chloroflexota bacterium]